MIDLELINEKCLIALQALQDIMNESEQYKVPDALEEYLTDVKVWGIVWNVQKFFRELKNLQIKGEVEDWFVSNDKDIGTKDLWLFVDGYAIEARNLRENKPAEDIRITSLHGNAAWINFKRPGFDLENETSISAESPSKFQVSVKLDQILTLSAEGVKNCKHLLEIYRKYFAPLLFPV